METVFAQESERVRVAVLQHLLDVCSTKLIAAPNCLGGHYQGSSWTFVSAGPSLNVYPGAQRGLVLPNRPGAECIFR